MDEFILEFEIIKNSTFYGDDVIMICYDEKPTDIFELNRIYLNFLNLIKMD